MPVLAQNSVSVYENWGQFLHSFSNSPAKASNADDIYAKGKNCIVLKSDVQKATKFYTLTGMTEDKAQKAAAEYEMQREALYQKAISEGYTVTDQEVQSYLDELKETINSSKNRSEAYAIINQFDSEDEYWNYEFEIYKKDLPIQKYNEDLQKQYYQTETLNESTENDDKWAEYYEDFKEKLVAEENYEILED